MIRTLQSLRVTWAEHHFAPLIEAFCQNGEMEQGFEVLGTMRSYDVTPNAGTAFPLYRKVVGSLQRLDGAWKTLDELNRDGKVVDITALNVVVRAAVRLEDLQRALGIYQAFPEFNATPNVDTFNFLLAGCIHTSHRQLGDKLMNEMREAGVKPDAVTFERVITLCLTQATYEDAFYYLEEMKAQGFVPAASVYESVVRKCVLTGDPRHKLAFEEMLSYGYEVSPRLQAFVDSGGQPQEEEFVESENYASTRPTRRPRDITGAGSRGISRGPVRRF